MYKFLKNISNNSKNTVRKFIYDNIKQAFDETDLYFENLCYLLYADNINNKQSKETFLDILDTFTCIDNSLKTYIEHQSEVIGVDKDCKVNFIKKKLKQYKLITDELKEDIKKRISKETYFADNKAERHIVIHLYEEFLSYSNELDKKLSILKEKYDELYQMIHSNDSERVLNRFNNHFKDVSNHVTESLTFKPYCDLLSNMVCVKKKPKSEKLASLNHDGWKRGTPYPITDYFHKVVYDIIGNDFYSVYDQPLELARTIQEKELDNEQVNELFAAITIATLQSNKGHGESKHYSRPRGRPQKDLCYTDCIDVLKEIIKDTRVMYSPRKRRTNKKEFFNWSVTVFVSLLMHYKDSLIDCISTFYRLLKQFGMELPFGLRHFQNKIKEYCDFLRDRKKGGFYNIFDGEPTRLWARKLKRFAQFDEFRNIITENYLRPKLA